jgi:hypothetical protein
MFVSLVFVTVTTHAQPIPTNPPPNLSIVNVVNTDWPEGHIFVYWQGIPNQIWLPWASTNLVDWYRFGNETAFPDGTHYSETSAMGYPQIFFQLRFHSYYTNSTPIVTVNSPKLKRKKVKNTP